MSIGELPLDIPDLTDRLNQLNDLFNYLLNRVDILNAELINQGLRITNVEHRLDNAENQINNINNSITNINGQISNINNQINNINNSITNINGQINNLTSRINNLETRVDNLASAVQSIDSNIANIWDQLATCLRKANPINGYNPYNLTGTVTAKVWMYEITPINDNNIKFYYVQFNEISGPSGGISSWIPLPGNVTFNNFIYTYHPEYHIGGNFTGAPTIPAAYSGDGISYRLIISNTEDAFRLVINAGTPGGDDYIGFLIIGNK
jgi:archaellum component FlaC